MSPLRRKICKACRCSQEDHCLSSDLDDDRKIGRLLMDSKYSTLTARVKGGDGVRIYKRNRMIVTNPIATGKDPTFDTITYEWAPPGVTQKLVRQRFPIQGSLSNPCTWELVLWVPEFQRGGGKRAREDQLWFQLCSYAMSR